MGFGSEMDLGREMGWRGRRVTDGDGLVGGNWFAVEMGLGREMVLRMEMGLGWKWVCDEGELGEGDGWQLCIILRRWFRGRR